MVPRVCCGLSAHALNKPQRIRVPLKRTDCFFFRLLSVRVCGLCMVLLLATSRQSRRDVPISPFRDIAGNYPANNSGWENEQKSLCYGTSAQQNKPHRYRDDCQNHHHESPKNLNQCFHFSTPFYALRHPVRENSAEIVFHMYQRHLFPHLPDAIVIQLDDDV